jgi:hypothetical protein
LLHAGRERKVFLNLLLAVLQQLVRCAKLRFGVFLLGYVGKGDDGKLTAIRVLERTSFLGRKNSWRLRPIWRVLLRRS